MGRVLDFFLRYRNQVIFIVTPLLLLPLPILVTDQKGTCGFLLLLMAVYWCTETLPLAATGLLPVVFVPMFGIMSTSAVCFNYLKDTTMMFVGGLMVAIAVENCMLHKRIALRIIMLCGTKPRWLMLGFMLPTWFISMWISNTATTAMMMPIMEAVLEQLRTPGSGESRSAQAHCYENDIELDELSTRVEIKTENGTALHSNAEKKVHVKVAGSTSGNAMTEMEQSGKSYDLSNKQETADAQVTSEESEDEEEARFMYLAKGMTLAVAYAANTGGLATLTGTGSTPIMKGHADDLWQARGYPESPITYTSWLVMGFPVAVINLVIVWLWLQTFYLGLRGTCACFFSSTEDPARQEAAQEVLNKAYADLGPIRYAEVVSGCMFIALVLLWFFRSPGFIDGWASFQKAGFIGDAVPAMMIASLLFIIPMELPTCSSEKGSGLVDTILNWPVVHQKMPWSIVFLMGGGFALAEACEESGLSQWIGDQLAVFGSLPGWLMIMIICFMTTMLTEVTSNNATCTILMPIMSAMAESLGYNPLYLMIPTAMSTSFAFMLPVATPPNAIAFSYGRLKVLDMVKAGAILNVTGVLVVTLATTTWGMGYFQLDVLPWDNNSTLTTQLPPYA